MPERRRPVRFLTRDEAAGELERLGVSPQEAEITLTLAEDDPSHREEVGGVVVTCYPAAEYGTAADRFQVLAL
jgi:hypothetical protein